MGLLVYWTGDILYHHAPQLHTNGWQLLVWGFALSTIITSHATFTINSLDHMYGSRRYNLTNTSRNNWLMAIFTLGEGWHNNHHHYPLTARAGFYWWEYDIVYYILTMLSWLRIVTDLKQLPVEIREDNHVQNQNNSRGTGKGNVTPLI